MAVGYMQTPKSRYSSAENIRALAGRLDNRMSRYLIEGSWSTSGRNAHVVHRTTTTDARFAAKVQRAGYIRFGDGTCLKLFVRECKPNERFVFIHGYTRLINDCAYFNLWDVAQLEAKEKEAKVIVQEIAAL